MKVIEKLVTEKYSDIEAEEMEWLWENKIPKEGVTIFVGDPETYKSTTSLYVAAQVSRGRCFPNCEKPTPRGSVLIISSEDSHSKVVLPRLMAAEANLDKIERIVEVKKITLVNGKKGKKKKKVERYGITDLIAEIDLLEKKIKSMPDFKLLIIDTLGSYLGSRRINDIGDTRGFMDRISELSYRHHFAAIIIHHFNKNEDASAQYRSAGSVAIRGAARAQWGFVLDPHDKDRAFMLRDKLNSSTDRTGLAFRMEEIKLSLEGKPNWIGRCNFEDKVIHEDLSTFLSKSKSKQSPEKDRAVKWIKDYLKDGKKHRANPVIAAADQYGIAEKTLRRAMTKAGVKTRAVKNLKTKKFDHWSWWIEN